MKNIAIEICGRISRCLPDVLRFLGRADTTAALECEDFGVNCGDNPYDMLPGTPEQSHEAPLNRCNRLAMQYPSIDCQWHSSRLGIAFLRFF
jgi:hypothetical protein